MVLTRIVRTNAFSGSSAPLHVPQSRWRGNFHAVTGPLSRPRPRSPLPASLSCSSARAVDRATRAFHLHRPPPPHPCASRPHSNGLAFVHSLCVCVRLLLFFPWSGSDPYPSSAFHFFAQVCFSRAVFILASPLSRLSSISVLLHCCV